MIKKDKQMQFKRGDKQKIRCQQIKTLKLKLGFVIVLYCRDIFHIFIVYIYRYKIKICIWTIIQNRYRQIHRYIDRKYMENNGNLQKKVLMVILD